MRKLIMIAAALACLALPAMAQTTTTVTSQPQATPPPPPPSTTTVTTNPPPSTQVVVNPNENTSSTSTSSHRVRVSDEATGVETRITGRTAVAIVATDALYGGIAGLLVGGGIALINNGDRWQRDLMVGAGIGILAGATAGVVEAVMQDNRQTTVRAAADRDPAAASSGPAFAALAGKF
jgi:hypothetical protein